MTPVRSLSIRPVLTLDTDRVYESDHSSSQQIAERAYDCAFIYRGKRV